MISKFSPMVALQTYISIAKAQKAALEAATTDEEKIALQASMNGLEDFRAAWSNIEGVEISEEDANKKLGAVRTYASNKWMKKDGKVVERQKGVEVDETTVFRLPNLIKPEKKRGRTAGVNLSACLDLLNSLQWN